jgi:hypothetical protein
MSDLTAFKEKVIQRFSAEITDRVFLMIQNDRELLKEYINLLGTHPQKTINSSLAKEIKKRYGLDNKDLKNENPHSLLIQSHERFD